jgi:lysophospholipase L1-like esterase
MKIDISFKCMFLIMLLLTGCSKSIPQLSPLSSNHTILAFGDSLTWGTGTIEDQSYPAILEQLTGIRVINEGIPGEVSAKGLARLPSLLDKYQPQLLILCHGGNDILRRKSMGAMAENIREMIREAQQREIEVVLIGVPQFSLFSYESDERYQQIAAEFKIPYEAEILPSIESDDKLKSDKIHPNAAGYRKMAEAIYQLLLTHSAL